MGAGDGAAVAPPPRPPPPSFVAGIVGELRSLVGRAVPRTTDERATRTGFASDSRRDPFLFTLALLIAVGFALLWIWIVRVAPVPPGGDPSTWMLTGYAFVGLPTTPGIQPLAYPPLAFPFVGLAVLLGGGPLNGGRLFMASAIALLGVATYLLGRSLLERPALALLAEGLWIAEPDFQQLYYFGGYPNLFALIFLVFAVAYLVRYLRTRRPRHLFLFWVATAVCLLAHSLTGVVLVGTLLFTALGLAAVGRLPRGLVTERAGRAGLAVLLGGLGLYYGGTLAVGIGHPTYFETTALSASKTTLLPSVLRPFYLDVPLRAVAGPTAAVSPTAALAILLAASAGIVAAFVALRLVRPEWLTTPWIVLAASILTVFVGALAAYFFAFQIDYRRFPYFLYGPALLAALYPVDWALSEAMNRDWGPWLRARARRAPGRLPPPLARWGGRRSRWRHAVDPVVAVAACLLLLGAAQFVTLPAGRSYEAYYTLYAHDASFLAAVHAISGSGIGGNLVTTTAYVAHWPSTLTGTRTTYVPALSNGNAYATSHVTNGETTTLSLAGRLTVTNALVAATLPGLTAGFFNASPVYGAFSGNLYQALAQVPTSSLVVGLADGRQFVVSPPGAPAPVVNQIAGGYGYELTFVEPGFVLEENVTAVPASATVAIALAARANATAAGISYLQARLTAPSLVPAAPTLGAGPGTFWWNATARTGAYATQAAVTPASALGHLIAATPTAAAAVALRENATAATGAPALALGLTLTTPAATNVLPLLGPWISTGDVWTLWEVRFVLLFSGVLAPTMTAAYLVGEWRASLLTSDGEWSVYVLPAELP